MTKLKKLQIPLKDFQKVAILNSIFILFFTLLPFIIGFALNLSTGQDIVWSRFYSNGEFYLYSTALISSSYLIYYKYKVKPADIYSLFSIVSLMLIVLISVLYASRVNSVTVYIPFIRWASLVFIFIAIPLNFYSQLIYCKLSPDIGKQRREEQQEIMDALG